VDRGLLGLVGLFGGKSRQAVGISVGMTGLKNPAVEVPHISVAITLFSPHWGVVLITTLMAN
jgi:hypothetical protein